MSMRRGSSLRSFGNDVTALVVGATGGIGSAFVQELRDDPGVASIHALSRSALSTVGASITWHPIDIEKEESIAAAAEAIKDRAGSLQLILLASGVLHQGDRLKPEKTWRSLDGEALATAFRVNAIGPALVAKHFLPLLSQERKTVFAALSARVGSIEDNALGGWYAYRASKAGLNMLLKTLSIELARRNPTAICVGLHPGTVDSALSKPFQSSVPRGRLFTPTKAAHALLDVVDGLTARDSGKVFAWDGQAIPY